MNYNESNLPDEREPELCRSKCGRYPACECGHGQCPVCGEQRGYGPASCPECGDGYKTAIDDHWDDDGEGSVRDMVDPQVTQGEPWPDLH